MSLDSKGDDKCGGPMNSPSSATHRHRLFIRYMGKNGAGKDARARGELAREPIVWARPNVLLHFVFRLRMRQLSPLTHRSSIRFCTQSCGGKNKKDFGAGFGGSAHPEQRLNRASIADRSIHRRLLLHQRRAPHREIFCNRSNPVRGSRSDHHDDTRHFREG